jgi:D-aspartate ligase
VNTARAAPAALVLGDMELVRPLALAGIRSWVVAVPGDPTRFSRHARTIATWDVSSGNDDLVDRLVRWGRAQPTPPVLFYQWDGHLLFVSRHRDRLAQAFRFVVEDPARVEALVDKERFHALAGELGLPVPPARTLASGDGGLAPDLGDLGFPLIVKPLHRADDRWASVEPSGKALRVDDPGQLAALWPRLRRYRRPVVAQRYVPGPESRVESYHVYVDERGRVAGEFTGRKLRTMPAEYGHTTALEITAAADVARAGREVVARLGLRGVAKLDFKRGPDGALHLLEVNPRFNLWHHPAARAGVNIPALAYADLTGRPRPPATPVRAGLRWCSPYDLWSARGSGVPLGRWCRWAVGCEAKAVWAWDDPLPFVGACVDQLGRRLVARARGRRGPRDPRLRR